MRDGMKSVTSGFWFERGPAVVHSGAGRRNPVRTRRRRQPPGDARPDARPGFWRTVRRSHGACSALAECTAEK